MHHFLNNDLILVTSKLFPLGIFDSEFQKIFFVCLFSPTASHQRTCMSRVKVYFTEICFLYSGKTQSSGHTSGNLKNLHQCQLLSNSKKISNAEKTRDVKILKGSWICTYQFSSLVKTSSFFSKFNQNLKILLIRVVI